MMRSTLVPAAALVLGACSVRAETITTPVPELVHMVDDAGPGDAAIIDDMDKAITTAMAKRDFAALNAMERDFRTSRARMPSGLWKLVVYYQWVHWKLSEDLDRETGCEARLLPFAEAWRAADPSAPAPVVAQAALLKSRGWCNRGDGFAASVAPAGWQRFHADLRAARTLLERNRTSASADPEYYAVMAGIYVGEAATRQELDDLVAEAAQREPSYQNTWFQAATYYLPQWHGSLADFDAFARRAAVATAATDKTGLYARIYWHHADCGCNLIKDAADWTFFKQSMRDIWSQYPVRWNGDYFQKLACGMKDYEEGRHYVRALSPEAHGDADLAARFSTCENTPVR